MEISIKPKTIKWIKRLLLFRLLIIVGSIIITTIVLFINPEEGFFTGYIHPFLLKSGISYPFDNPASTAGFFAGTRIITIILCILEYYLLNRKKRIGFWLAYVFDFYLALSLHTSVLILFIILILGLLKSSRLYFKSSELNSDGNNVILK